MNSKVTYNRIYDSIKQRLICLSVAIYILTFNIQPSLAKNNCSPNLPNNQPIEKIALIKIENLTQENKEIYPLSTLSFNQKIKNNKEKKRKEKLLLNKSKRKIYNQKQIICEIPKSLIIQKLEKLYPKTTVKIIEIKKESFFSEK
jgi:hypothetical protein